VPPLVEVVVKVTDVPWHTGPTGAIVIVGVTLPFVISISLLVAVAGLAHAALLVITTVTLSPAASVEVVNVDAVCPATAVPLTNHEYVGVVPPLVGVAVNVMLPPVQVVIELAPSATAGVTGAGTALITAAVDAPDVQVPSVTVNVYD